MLGALALQGDSKELAQMLKTNLGLSSVVKVLSSSGDLSEAAKFLFGSLRVLDQSPAEIILAELPENNEGLGYAIRDRLTKAAGPR